MLEFNNVRTMGDIFLKETGSTLYMALITAVIAGLIGLALGVILVVTSKGGILENRLINSILDKFINLLRSIPFIIMLAIIAPLTYLIVKTRIGENAAIVPLVFGTFPFYARQIENALHQIDKGVIEAAQAMGDSPWDIIKGVYLKESLPSIIRASSLTLISLIGLTAMAGAIGAGGLGKLAIARGYQRYQDDVTLVSTLIILAIVFIIQAIGDWLVKKTSH